MATHDLVRIMIPAVGELGLSGDRRDCNGREGCKRKKVGQHGERQRGTRGGEDVMEEMKKRVCGAKKLPYFKGGIGFGRGVYQSPQHNR